LPENIWKLPRLFTTAEGNYAELCIAHGTLQEADLLNHAAWQPQNRERMEQAGRLIKTYGITGRAGDIWT
jgi:hypothetical protein